MERKVIDTDVLIIGGGTAGCFAGITLGKRKDIKGPYCRESEHKEKRMSCSRSKCDKCIYNRGKDTTVLCRLCKEGCRRNSKRRFAVVDVREVKSRHGHYGETRTCYTKG